MYRHACLVSSVIIPKPKSRKRFANSHVEKNCKCGRCVCSHGSCALSFHTCRWTCHTQGERDKFLTIVRQNMYRIMTERGILVWIKWSVDHVIRSWFVYKYGRNVRQRSSDFSAVPCLLKTNYMYTHMKRVCTFREGPPCSRTHSRECSKEDYCIQHCKPRKLQHKHGCIRWWLCFLRS